MYLTSKNLVDKIHKNQNLNDKIWNWTLNGKILEIKSSIL